MSEPLSAEEAVARFGFYTGLTRGDSMEPMLRQGRDRVCIERRTGRLRRYEVPLYRRPSGQLVLHRIVKVLPEGRQPPLPGARCDRRDDRRGPDGLLPGKAVCRLPLEPGISLLRLFLVALPLAAAAVPAWARCAEPPEAPLFSSRFEMTAASAPALRRPPL